MRGPSFSPQLKQGTAGLTGVLWYFIGAGGMYTAEGTEWDLVGQAARYAVGLALISVSKMSLLTNVIVLQMNLICPASIQPST